MPRPTALPTASPAAVHRLVIPGFHPARLNELRAGRWQSARLKKRDRRVIGDYAVVAGIPRATGKRRVTLTVVLGPRQRGADPDAFWKSLLDAMTHCGAITDDNRHGVELMPVRYERGAEKAVIIELEDMES